MEREKVLKEGAEGDVNGEKLDIDKEFKSDDGSKEISPDDSTLGRYDGKDVRKVEEGFTDFVK